jgi:multicomponent Na+:H+ antiporter subunit D
VSNGQLLGWLVATPCLGGIAVLLTGRWPALRDGLSLVSAGMLFLLVVMVALRVSSGEQLTLVLAEPLSSLSLALAPEPLGIVFALVASFLWPVTTIYAKGYMHAHEEGNQTRFYAAFALSLGATMGVAFAGNMLTLFVFYELLTLATYPLVTHAGTDEAKQAGRVYLGVLMGTSIGFLLLAIIWTWYLAGTLDFTPGGILGQCGNGTLLGVLLVLYVLGTGKAALMPFHRWLPRAMVAPTPVSALLHAVAVVKAGVFTILKVAVYIFGLDLIGELALAHGLAYLAGLTILVASLVALTRDNLKARLAYSTVSQLGYIVLGAVLGVTSGVVGGSMHIAMHAFGKITLFFCAGAVLVAARKTRVSELDGIGRRMPLTMGAFLIGSLSIVGLPPMGGTWSKWMLVQATLDAETWILMGLLLLSSVLNLLYLVVIPVRAFFAPPSARSDVGGMREAPLTCLLAMAVTTSGCVLLFFAPGPLLGAVGQIFR